MFLLNVLLFWGCSKNIENPLEPEPNQTDQPKELLKHNPAANKVDKPQLNPILFSKKYDKNKLPSQLETCGESEYEEVEGMEQMYWWAYGAIFDETEVGGLPSLSFLAGSASTDYWGYPVPIDYIAVFAEAEWKYVNGSSWSPLWSDSEEKTNDWIAEVFSGVIAKRQPWTGKLEADHGFHDEDYDWYPHLGPAYRTAYLLDQK
jgi:hypothetical protein